MEEKERENGNEKSKRTKVSKVIQYKIER